MNKRTDIRNIYVPEEFKPIWTKFLTICVREGESASVKIRRFIEDYVRLHEPGNPQQTLTHIIKNGKAYVAPKTCEFKGCQRIAVIYAEYVPKRKTYAICKFHLEQIEDNKFWKVKK